MNEPTTAGIIFFALLTVLAFRALGKFLEVYPTDVHHEPPRKLPRAKRRPVRFVGDDESTRSGFEWLSYEETYKTW